MPGTGQEPRTGAGILRLDFAPDNGFHAELRRRIDAYFKLPGHRRRDCWQMYLKAAIILGCFAASYVGLVFLATTVWQALALDLVLAASTALIGFNIQHDAGHQAFSDRRWINRLMAMTMDLIGASSYDWFWKHTVIHHRYVNILGYDLDSDIHPLGRFNPHQPRLPAHRYQHVYLWFAYGFEGLKLQLVDDFRYVFTRRVGPHRLPRASRWDLVTFLCGKVAFFGLAFVIPMMLHPVWVVLFYYVLGASVLGVAMVLVFVLPHLVGGATFPLPVDGTARVDVPWAVHQAQSTLDFARDSRAWTWLLGGLNYHKEHHLFPNICHVNYPGMSKVVEQTCRDFGLEYGEHASMRAGIAAHYRWLKQLGSAG